MRPVFACASVVATVALAALAATVDARGAQSPLFLPSTSHARRQRQQRRPCRLGPGRHAVRRGRGPELRRTAIGRMVGGAARAVHQQPDLQRRRAEPLLRERRLAVGLGLGPVHRPRLRPARRDAGRVDADRVRRRRSARVVHERLRRDRLLRARPPRRAPASTSPRQQINTISQLHRRVERLRRHDARLDWLRRARSTATRQQRADAAAATDGYLPRVDARGNAATAPPMDLMGALMGDAAGARSSPATCGRTRTSR